MAPHGDGAVRLPDGSLTAEEIRKCFDTQGGNECLAHALRTNKPAEKSPVDTFSQCMTTLTDRVETLKEMTNAQNALAAQVATLNEARQTELDAVRRQLKNLPQPSSQPAK